MAPVWLIYITFPTTFVYDCLKILGVVLNWKDDFLLSVSNSVEKQTQLELALTFKTAFCHVIMNFKRLSG